MRPPSAQDSPPPPRTGAVDRDPVVEACKRGIDRTLLRQNLRRSVTERVENLMALQALAEEARRAGRDARGEQDGPRDGSAVAPRWCNVVNYGEPMEKSEPRTGARKALPVRVSVSIDASDYADIKNIARNGRVSVAWVVRDAVARYLDSRTPLLTRGDADAKS